MTVMARLIHHFQAQSLYLRYAVRLMMACTLTACLCYVEQWPNGYWALFSVVGCVWPTQGISVQRMWQRLAGTFLGIGLGILLAYGLGEQPIAISFLLPLAIFLMFYLKVFGYSFFVFFASVVTMLLVSLLDPGDWHMAITRLVMTVFGVSVAGLSNLLIFPVHESRRLPKRLHAVRNSLRFYFVTLCERYQGHCVPEAVKAPEQAFYYLQDVSDAVKQSGFEWSSQRAKVQHGETVQHFNQLYERLLAVEIHLPKEIHCPALQPLLPALGHSMRSIMPLFDQVDTHMSFAINTQLTEIQCQITSRRTTAAKEPHLPAAIFYDYIQLTLFIQSLQALLVDLSQAAV